MSRCFNEYEEQKVKRIIDDCQGKRNRDDAYDSILHTKSDVSISSNAGVPTVESSSKTCAGLNINNAWSSILHIESDVSIISSNAAASTVQSSSANKNQTNHIEGTIH